VPFKVSPEARKLYEERIIPFWKGKTMREMIFAEMTPEWIRAYNCGFFTEFMEQRAPGHAVLGGKLYQQGLCGYQQEIKASLHKLDFLSDPEAYAKQEELKAMLVSIAALIRFAERHADKAGELAAVESDPRRKQELVRIAEICRHVPGNPPHDFWEALQAYWFVHLGITTELNTWDSFSPGRLDQHLYPFYTQGAAQGSLTAEQATELLQCFWIKFNNQPAPPKVGVTAEESGTYTDFAQISAGGVQEDGSDGVNEVSYLMMDVVQEMRLIQPNASVQISKKNPDRFLKRVARVIRTGIGQPSVFNTEEIIQELVRQGTSVEDARCGGTSGCVETSAFGKENHNLTGYLNMPKVLEITLHNGVDPRTGQCIGPETGDPRTFTSFGELFAAYEKQLKHLVDVKIRGSNVIERLYAQYMPTPLMSLLVDDCTTRAKDYHDGGARYNMSYIQGVGLGSLTDTFAALKYHLFDHKDMSMADLLQALQNDFNGHEGLRLTLLNKTPKYGNDDDYADDIMKRCFEAYYAAIDGRPNTKGGQYHISLFPTTVHVYFGSVIGATADGRKAWQPLSEGISPVQGADRHGPTAVIRSAAKMDHVRTGGTLLNQKFTPRLLKDDEGLDMLAHLVRSYFTLDGHHIQFNVVDVATLRAAQANPEAYRDLIVRVAGYSDYFCDLGRALQDEVIARTEHESF
jgi:formate C-acetyltransferase